MVYDFSSLLGRMLKKEKEKAVMISRKLEEIRSTFIKSCS